MGRLGSRTLRLGSGAGRIAEGAVEGIAEEVAVVAVGRRSECSSGVRRIGAGLVAGSVDMAAGWAEDVAGGSAGVGLEGLGEAASGGWGEVIEG